MTLLGQNVNAVRRTDGRRRVVDLADADPSCCGRAGGCSVCASTTSHPLHFNDSLIEAYASVPALANHLHLPVQSGSDRVLALMKRGYTTRDYQARIRGLRDVRPDIAISTDIIVAFRARASRISRRRSSSSKRWASISRSVSLTARAPGTPAAALADDVPRRDQAGAAGTPAGDAGCAGAQHQPRPWLAARSACCGKACKRDRAELAGRTENNRWVNFTGPDSLLNRFTAVTVTEALPHSLRGRLAA